MLALCTFLCLIVNVLSEGYYNVLGPRIIRPNSEYHCAISVQATSEPTRVTVVLEGTSYTGRPFLVQNQVLVQPYTARISRLEVGDLEDGAYKLQVRGNGGLDFVTYFPLQFVQKSYSVFIQTDRAVYSPGSKIQFKAIVLNPHLKPAAEVRNELLHISIADGQGNRVKEWRRVEAIRGIFTGELQLSSQVNYGKWNISVEIHGQKYSKTVDVADYILPKFIVDVETAKHVTFKDNLIQANINTKYNYGKKVKGEATITVFPMIYSSVIQPIFENPVRRVIPIDGIASVQFNIAKDLRLNDEYERTVVLDVVIEESLTGRRENNSVHVHLHKYDHKMELIKTSDYFKPGLKYTAYVRITNHDESPLQPSRNDFITVRHGYSRTDEVYHTAQHPIDKSGIVKLEYFTPTNVTNSTALRIEAEYGDLKERISPIPAAISFSGNFLQVELETEQPIVNLDVEVLVNCTEAMQYVNYVLMGRGDVLATNTFRVDGAREYRFRFTATHAMVPVSHLIVSYVRGDGELVGDAIDIEVDDRQLQNFIDIQVNAVESEPDMDLEITVRAQQNSYVALMAIDENVARLGGDFDLNQQQVTEELKRYDVGSGTPYTLVRKDGKSHFMWKPGGSNPHSAIYESGADILTNAHINRHKPTLEDIYLRPVFYGSSTVKPDRGFGLPLKQLTGTRPPNAGPYAFSRIPRPVWNHPKVYLSEMLAPTWLFTNFSSGYEGKTSLRRRLPNTLNTWLISGFSLDPLHGLGLITAPKRVKVSKPFVVTLDLPFSMQRGEILAVPIVVYNHINEDLVAEITLHNPEHKFEFAEVANDVNAPIKKIELYRRKKVTVPRNSATSVSFMIIPLKHGRIEIKATANSPKSQDVVAKDLLVTLEGETEHYTKSLLIDLRRANEFKGNITIDLPKNIVADSERIDVSILGDLFGATIINLANLIRLPTGCGEQNLIHLVPNLIVLEYLRNTRQTTDTIETDALNYLETSYQQELSYRRKDGSFSPFGGKDANGNVWLTSNVVLAFKRARPFVYIDEAVITKALDFLVENQARNGSFVETGNVIHHQMEDRNGKSLALTAFTLLAFLERKYSPFTYSNYTNAIEKGLDYIARYIDEAESVYTLSVCSYVLHLAKHPSKLSAFNLLDIKAHTNGTVKWWAVDDGLGNETQNVWRKVPRSVDIEATSYAVLSLIEANLVEDAMPVLNWLVQQQNSLGGFESTQDTIMGLYAYYNLALRLTTTVSMEVEFAYRKQESNRIKINRNSALVLQTVEISKTAKQVNVTATGSGLAVFQVAYEYNVNVTGPWPMFTLDPQVDKNSNQHHLQVSICTAFVSRNLSETGTSNMAVMEVTLPSGYTADVDALPSLELTENVQKVQTSNGLTKIILYFNNLTRIESCPTISAFRTHKVAKQKPVSVVVYDYYDSSRRARIFYNGPRTTLCDICEEENCGDICTKEAEADSQRASESKSREKTDDGGSAKSLETSIVFLTFLLILTFVP